MPYLPIKSLLPYFGRTSLVLMSTYVHRTLRCYVSQVFCQDHYRIVIFERSECFKDAPPLKSHLTLVDGPHRPSDQFLRLHFQRCITVNACGGDIRDDYNQQDIDGFMDELGVFDNDINTADPRWETPLCREVYSYLLREKLEKCVLVFVTYICQHLISACI
jgi:hypothetical protein